jgi:predicted HAD superfamily Cof-like phosphohydrolase
MGGMHNMQFKLEDRVFIVPKKKKGVVKGLDGNKVKVTYFEKGTDERQTDWFDKKELKKHRKKRKLRRGLDYAADQVRQFHKAFNHLTNSKPTVIPTDVAIARTHWTAEELVEFLYATAKGEKEEFINMVMGLKQSIDNTTSKIIEKGEPVEDVLVAQADALTDINYFTQGSFVIMGVDPQPLFDIVQNANMAKLFPDGKPRYREEDGKIIKPDGWEAPEPKLKAEIQRQMKVKK